MSQLNRVSNDCASQLFNNFFKSSWNWDRIGSEEHHDHSLASRGLTVRSRWSASALLGTARLQACTMAIALGQSDRTAHRGRMCCSVARSGGQSRRGGGTSRLHDGGAAKVAMGGPPCPLQLPPESQWEPATAVAACARDVGSTAGRRSASGMELW